MVMMGGSAGCRGGGGGRAAGGGEGGRGRAAGGDRECLVGGGDGACLAEQLDAARSAVGEAGRPQRYPERARAFEGPGERDLLGCECSGFGLCAEREVGERGVGAPRRDGRGGDAQASEEVAGGEEVAEGRRR